MRALAGLVVSSLVFALTGCGRPPTAPSTQAPAVTISGAVVSQDGEPISGASIWIREHNRANTFTNPDGRFTWSGFPLPSGRLQFWMAQGRVPEFGDIVPRDVGVALLQARDGVVVDVIRDAPPFSMTFYEEFVRNARDGSGTAATRPWTLDPSFYIRTTHVDTGEAIPGFVIDGIENVFRNSVPQLSGGRRQVAAVERGTEERPLRDGWVNVQFQIDLPTSGAQGQATVGGNQGNLWIQYLPDNPRLFDPGSSCAFALGVADHEIAHTMGYYHATSIPGVVERPMQSLDFCQGTPRPEIVRYHANIMYSRPFGNLPPDRDPASVVYQQTGAAARPGPVVACALEQHR
jgi:hypothetical protein